jgi:hypothetical protein
MPAITSIPPWAERPKQSEDQQRNEDEEGEEMAIALDHDRLTVGSSDYFGIGYSPPVAITPIAVGKVHTESNRYHDGQNGDNNPASHLVYLLRAHARLVTSLQSGRVV